MKAYSRHFDIIAEIETYGYIISYALDLTIIRLKNKHDAVLLEKKSLGYSDFVEKLEDILIYVKRIEKLKRILGDDE